jgi:TolB-like protein
MYDLRKIYGAVIGMIGWVLFLMGCVETRIQTEQPGSLSGVKTVLVLTFDDVTAAHGEKGMIKCPLCGNYFESGQVPPDTADRLTQRTVETLRRQTDLAVVVHDRTNNIGAEKLSERQRITRAGKAAGADAVLTGYIYRYEDRIGTNFAVKNPASVALSIHLIRVVDGIDIWSGYVDETQQALAEDIFKTPEFLRRKGQWVSADEMADAGLDKIFESFPKP